ncbi:nucleoside-diphosphate kinase [Streptomyces sp. NPDC090135]|uniref:nucleoside-diphosphate kinase n=1 Tax=Streptomyces sp. NPDC090135 TaxID=3365957 RepID=UPI00381A85F7
MNRINWGQLTYSETKSSFYSNDIYFREGYRDAKNALGPNFDYFLRSCALMVIKPDGVITGKLNPVLRYVRTQGFVVSIINKFELIRFHWRELWRYQLNAASLERFAVADACLTDKPALFMILYDTTGGEIPATVRLTNLKGPSDPAGRDPGTLRSAIGQTNKVLSYVHVADEPADMIRELGIILTRPQRLRMMACLGNPYWGSEDVLGLDLALRDHSFPKKRFSFVESFQRVEEIVNLKVEAGERYQSEIAVRIRAALLAMRENRQFSLVGFMDDLEQFGLLCDPWDLAVLGAHLSPQDEPGATKLIGSAQGVRWRP